MLARGTPFFCLWAAKDATHGLSKHRDRYGWYHYNMHAPVCQGFSQDFQKVFPSPSTLFHIFSNSIFPHTVSLFGCRPPSAASARETVAKQIQKELTLFLQFRHHETVTETVFFPLFAIRRSTDGLKAPRLPQPFCFGARRLGGSAARRFRGFLRGAFFRSRRSPLAKHFHSSPILRLGGPPVQRLGGSAAPQPYGSAKAAVRLRLLPSPEKRKPTGRSV